MSFYFDGEKAFQGEKWTKEWKSHIRCWQCGTDHEIFARSTGADSRFNAHYISCHNPKCRVCILRVGDNVNVLVKSVKKPSQPPPPRARPRRPAAQWAKRHNMRLRDLEDVFENYLSFDARLYAKRARDILTDRELAVLGLRWNAGYTFRKIGELARPKVSAEAVRHIHGRALWHINLVIRALEKEYE